MERSPVLDLPMSPHPFTVAMHDPLSDGQKHAAAVELRGPVQSLEHSEELVGVLHAKSGAVVFA